MICVLNGRDLHVNYEGSLRFHNEQSNSVAIKTNLESVFIFFSLQLWI